MKKLLYYSVLAIAILLSSSSSLLQKDEGTFTIHLMGDSTMAPKKLDGGNPERGWGMVFPNFLDDSIRVINYAQNGRSTKSFITLGLWDKVKAAIKPGDYVFIQFGHNDAKESDTTRYAPAYGLYQENLRLFVNTARKLGAKPVLLTPVSRRWFKNGVLDENCHTDYPAAMKQVAQELEVPLLDITTATQSWLKELGDEASRDYFMWVKSGTITAMPEGKEDNTHTKARGARAVAQIVCDAIAEQLPEIASHLVHYDIVVAQDGTGDYFTVQEAINAVPDYSHDKITTVLIKDGIYEEMVTIPHNKFRIHITGQSTENTIITYYKYATKHWPDSEQTIGTSGSATMYIHSSYVTLENLTVANSSGEGKEIGQAVALFTNGDFLFFKNCRIIGNQDTLYTYGRYNKEGGACRNYFLDCYIEGTTDFIFGCSVAYFEKCIIHSKKNSYITAASTFEGRKYGYVFKNCALTADEGVTEVYLGRPWRPFAKTVFIDCTMGGHIVPEGWHNWKKPDAEKTSYYAEYGSTGPGAASAKQRVGWSHQLSKEQLADYTFEKVMDQGDGIIWNPTGKAHPKDTDSMAVKMVRSEMARCPDATSLDFLQGKLKWNYTTGLELKSFLDVYEKYGNQAIFDYAEHWYDAIISEDGTIATYKESNYNTDHICPGKTLFYLYDKTGKAKYLKAIERLRHQLDGHPRTTEGGFWHKKVYPSQMWLDGLYMAQPFYAEYTARYEEPAKKEAMYKDIVNHFRVVAEHTFDAKTGLYRHAWDESRQMFWCDKVTGQSEHAWGRALGWYMMAIVDVLDFIPERLPERAELVSLLRQICEVLPTYADPVTGMWYQVLDCPRREGNYLEATCSAMFSYAFLKAVRKGYIDRDKQGYAVKTYENFCNEFVRTLPDGTISIKNCCSVAGLGGKDNRSGNYAYYIGEPIRDNDAKGVGPFIWASLEYEMIP